MSASAPTPRSPRSTAAAPPMSPRSSGPRWSFPAPMGSSAARGAPADQGQDQAQPSKTAPGRSRSMMIRRSLASLRPFCDRASSAAADISTTPSARGRTPSTRQGRADLGHRLRRKTELVGNLEGVDFYLPTPSRRVLAAAGRHAGAIGGACRRGAGFHGAWRTSRARVRSPVARDRPPVAADARSS